MPSNDQASKPKAVFRPMTADEQALARALRRGALMVSAFDRDFAAKIHRQADARTPEITEKQAAMLRQLITRYRKKVNPASIPEAERHLIDEPKGKRRSSSAGEIATSIDFSKMASDRDAWQQRASDAIGELQKVKHELDLVREENADLRRQQMKLGELRSSGLLWLINRVVFHPRGFALAVHLEPDGRVTGWTLEGSGRGPWRFSESDDEASFAAAQSTLEAAAKDNATSAPATPPMKEEKP